MFAGAVSLASDAEIAIIELSVISGEGVDRQDLSLGNGAAVDMQSKLVASVAAVNNFIIVVLVRSQAIKKIYDRILCSEIACLYFQRASGAIAPMTFLELPSVRAVILQFLPGSQAGHALASIVLGDRNPSGKLPLSFPRGLEQTWVNNCECNPASSSVMSF